MIFVEWYRLEEGYMVSAAGLEPATHALKGVAAPRINDLEKFGHVKTR
jgi:hypothetical protein